MNIASIGGIVMDAAVFSSVLNTLLQNHSELMQTLGLGVETKNADNKNNSSLRDVALQAFMSTLVSLTNARVPVNACKSGVAIASHDNIHRTLATCQSNTTCDPTTSLFANDDVTTASSTTSSVLSSAPSFPFQTPNATNFMLDDFDSQVVPSTNEDLMLGMINDDWSASISTPSSSASDSSSIYLPDSLDAQTTNTQLNEDAVGHHQSHQQFLPTLFDPFCPASAINTAAINSVPTAAVASAIPVVPPSPVPPSTPLQTVASLLDDFIVEIVTQASSSSSSAASLCALENTCSHHAASAKRKRQPTGRRSKATTNNGNSNSNRSSNNTSLSTPITPLQHHSTQQTLSSLSSSSPSRRHSDDDDGDEVDEDDDDGEESDSYFVSTTASGLSFKSRKKTQRLDELEQRVHALQAELQQWKREKGITVAAATAASCKQPHDQAQTVTTTTPTIMTSEIVEDDAVVDSVLTRVDPSLSRQRIEQLASAAAALSTPKLSSHNVLSDLMAMFNKCQQHSVKHF